MPQFLFIYLFVFKNTFSHLKVLAVNDLAQALGFLPKIQIFACD